MAPRKVSGRVAVGAVLGIVALVLLLVAMSSTDWYVFGAEENDDFFGFDMKYEITFGLSSAEVEMTMSFEGETNTTRESFDYDDEEMSGDGSNFTSVANNTKYMLWTGIALSGAFIGLAFAGAAGLFSLGGARHVPLVVGLIAFIIVIIALAYFTAVFPGAIQEELEISDLGDTGYENYGFALILAFAASALLLVGTSISRRSLTPVVAGAFPGAYGPPPGPTSYTPPSYESAQPSYESAQPSYEPAQPVYESAQPTYQAAESAPAAPSTYDTSPVFGAPVAPAPGTTPDTPAVQAEVPPPAAPLPGICPSCGSAVGPTDDSCPICLARL